jgi:hypothetical protein
VTRRVVSVFVRFRAPLQLVNDNLFLKHKKAGYH